jgi:hypothetical protein
MKSIYPEVVKNIKSNMIHHYERSHLQIYKKQNISSIKNISKDISIQKIHKKNDALPTNDGFQQVIKTAQLVQLTSLLQTEKYILFQLEIDHITQII